MYNGKAESLDRLRYTRFCENVASSTSQVQPTALPPTSSSAYYHSFRVYLQVQNWMGRTDVNPKDWGWRIVDGKMMPVRCSLSPAPDNLLKIIKCTIKIIKCNCKTGCNSGRCTCRKNGLFCLSACAAWYTSHCENVENYYEIGGSDDEL